MSQETALERWQRLLTSRRDQMEAAYARLGRDNSDFWERRAGSFRRSSGIAADTDPLIQRVLALLPAGGSILDVGAGYGRLTLPLARSAGRITAVEPQPVMTQFLREGVAEGGIENLTILQAGWMDVEAKVEPSDIVLCTGVLFAQPGQEDIAAWLQALDAHARVAVVLGQVVSWGEPPLLAAMWQRLHGEPRIPTSTYIDVYDVLWELGIPANVEIYDTGRRITPPFADLAGAVAAIREQLILPDTAEVNAVLGEALQMELQPEGEGWALPPQSPVGATIWWERNGPRQRTIERKGLKTRARADGDR